jgi:hypothetical protein
MYTGMLELVECTCVHTACALLTLTCMCDMKLARSSFQLQNTTWR